MKLASLKSDTRDGELIIVSRALDRAMLAGTVAATLQEALDNWDELAPALAGLAADLEGGNVREAFGFDARDCCAPLPRAYQWVDGSAYVNHVELVRKARGAELPESFWHDPLVYQGGSDDLLGATDDIVARDEADGIDLEGEVAVITGDVPLATSAVDAGRYVRLITLVNDVSLRNRIPGELQKGFGFYQSKPATAFAPVVCTPDELGDAWRDGTVHLALTVHVNGVLLGAPHCGEDMTFTFHDLIAHAAATRRLGAGTIVGSGTISNYDRSRGSACLAEKRMLETLESGDPRTPFLRFGDRVRIEMFDPGGASVFGAIEQVVVRATT